MDLCLPICFRNDRVLWNWRAWLVTPAMEAELTDHVLDGVGALVPATLEPRSTGLCIAIQRACKCLLWQEAIESHLA